VFKQLETVQYDETREQEEPAKARLAWTSRVDPNVNPARVVIPFLWSRIHLNRNVSFSLDTTANGLSIVYEDSGKETYLVS
jgi:hypothetical protein